MQFKISAAAVLAFVASTIAQTAGFDSVFAPGSWETISAGKTFTVQWQVPPAYKGKSVSISLIGGATQGTQVPLQDIVSGISNDAGHYDWSVPADLGQANVYGLIIKLTDDPSVFQYSNPFKINGPAKASNPVQPVSKTTTANNYAVTSASSVHGYGVQTISLSSQAAAYTTVDVIDATVTVPCNNTNTPPTYTAPPPPPKVTGPVISNPYNNATWTTAIVPPVNTQGSSGNAPATTPAAPIQTPTEYPVTGAGARIGAGSVAVLGGLLVAALAL